MRDPFFQRRLFSKTPIIYFRHGYLWVAMIVNASVTVSMYFLVLFYLVMEKQLSPFSVVAKLASVKAILFFSFWYVAAENHK